jgi:hypothetical protein
MILLAFELQQFIISFYTVVPSSPTLYSPKNQLLIAPVIENVHLINFYGVAYRSFKT